MLTLSKIFPESVLLNGFFYTLLWPLVAHWILWQSEMQAACWMPAWLWLFQRSPVLGDGPSLLLLASSQLAGAVVTAVRVTGCEMCCCDSGNRSLYQWSLSTLFFLFLFTRKSRSRNKLLKGHLLPLLLSLCLWVRSPLQTELTFCLYEMVFISRLMPEYRFWVWTATFPKHSWWLFLQ